MIYIKKKYNYYYYLLHFCSLLIIDNEKTFCYIGYNYLEYREKKFCST